MLHYQHWLHVGAWFTVQTQAICTNVLYDAAAYK